MNLNEFIDRVIEDRITAIKDDFLHLEQKENFVGSISGFEKCRGKNSTELLVLLGEAQRATRKAELEHAENYWFARREEGDIEWVCNCVSVALLSKGHYPIITPTILGALKAMEIIGVSSDSVNGRNHIPINLDEQNFLTQLRAIEERDISAGGNSGNWNYVKEKIKIYFKEQESKERGMWGIFYSAWGYDRGDGERRKDYNKEAWMYVQHKLEVYESSAIT